MDAAVIFPWKQQGSFGLEMYQYSAHIKRSGTDSAIVVTHTYVLQHYYWIQYSQNQHCIVFYFQSLWQACFEHSC